MHKPSQTVFTKFRKPSPKAGDTLDEFYRPIVSADDRPMSADLYRLCVILDQQTFLSADFSRPNRKCYIFLNRLLADNGKAAPWLVERFVDIIGQRVNKHWSNFLSANKNFEVIWQLCWLIFYRFHRFLSDDKTHVTCYRLKSLTIVNEGSERMDPVQLSEAGTHLTEYNVYL